MDDRFLFTRRIDDYELRALDSGLGVVRISEEGVQPRGGVAWRWLLGKILETSQPAESRRYIYPSAFPELFRDDLLAIEQALREERVRAIAGRPMPDDLMEDEDYKRMSDLIDRIEKLARRAPERGNP